MGAPTVGNPLIFAIALSPNGYFEAYTMSTKKRMNSTAIHRKHDIKTPDEMSYTRPPSKSWPLSRFGPPSSTRILK